MSYEFKFPDVGEGITEGKLVHWKVDVGSSIKTDDAIAEVETDKAVVEIPSPVTGTVEELLFKEGDTLNVGKVIMKVAQGDASMPVQETPKEEVKTESEAPKEEEEIEEPKAEEKPIETAVQTPSVPAPAQEGVLAMPAVRKAAKDKGIDISQIKGTGPTGQITMNDLEGKPSSTPAPQVETPKVQEETKTEEPKKETPSAPAQSAVASSSSIDILASPSVKQYAREQGVDISKVKGTGDHGKITGQDVDTAKGGSAPAPSQEEIKTEAPKEEKATVIDSQPQPSTAHGDVRQEIKGIRATISKRMMESLQKSAQVTHTDEADINELVNLRTKEKEIAKEKGVKLSYLPFFIKAFIDTAKEYPIFNALVDDASNEVILKKDFNIAIATDTPQGLMVPVVKEAQNKSIFDLAKEISDLAQKARDSKISAAEMQGSTFTISSVGSLGGQVFTPIINYPEVAILGVGKIVKKPVARDDEVVIRDMITFSLTFDHRIVDGADAARFLKKFIEYIEDPTLMFMEL